MARPRLDELGGGASYTVTTDQGTPENFDGQQYYWKRSGGGNPKLKPWRANSIDVSFEKYFGNQGLCFGGALLQGHQDLHLQSNPSWKISVACRCPFNPADPASTYTEADANRIGLSTIKSNGKGGYVVATR